MRRVTRFSCVHCKTFMRVHPLFVPRRHQHKQFADEYKAKDFLPRDYKRYVEERWQRPVLESSVVAASDPMLDPKRHKYIMSMFPYPSGNLHMGHVRVYTISDVLARFFRLRKFKVIHPMGWDAFGLPAENAALERNLTPDKWTYSNIAYMRDQFDNLALDFDWHREFATCDPSYYRWTQSIFLDLFDAGLAYRADGWVNWDPVDQTVLAEEQVDQNGRSWRSGALVEKKLLKQWFIRTTRFAADLYATLSETQMDSGWRDVQHMQRNWIGFPDGIRVEFPLSQADRCKHPERDALVSSWTSKPHLLFGASFLLVKPNHPVVYGLETSLFTPVMHVMNPLTGMEVPVFVLSEEDLKTRFDVEYPRGHDTIVGFPGELQSHDALARAFGLRPVGSKMVHTSAAWRSMFNDVTSPTQDEATEEVCKFLLEKRLGGYWTSSRLRDWLISRQRFWGTPIPVIHCDSCGPVPTRDLPVKLPVCFAMPKGASPLKQFPEWNNARCPSCGKSAVRESDTMDTFMDSAWYHYRYLDPKNEFEPFSKEAAKCLPVDIYVGGKDHGIDSSLNYDSGHPKYLQGMELRRFKQGKWKAVLHLFYARSLHKFFQSQGKVNCPEPFHALCSVGQVMALTYRTKKDGRYLAPDMIRSATDSEGKKELLVDKNTGEGVEVLWEKMSKSKYNGVDPKETVDRIGVDTMRLLILDDAVPRSERRFSLHTLPGIERWQKRLVETVEEYCAARSTLAKRLASGSDDCNPENVPWLTSRNPKAIVAKDAAAHEEELRRFRNEMTSIITHEIGTLNRMSVAIRRMMGITKDLRSRPRAVVEESPEYEKLLAFQVIMLAPFAPHLACELWDGIAAIEKHSVDGFDWRENVLRQKWPEVDPDYSLKFIVMVNGREKVQEQLKKAELFAMSQEEAVQRALGMPELGPLRDRAYDSGVRLTESARVLTSDDYSVTVHIQVPQGLVHGRS